MRSESTIQTKDARFAPTIELERQLRTNIREALQGEVVETLMQLADSGDSDAYFRSVMEGHSLKVSKRLLEHLSDLFDDVKATLGFEQPVDFYVTGDSTVNAFSVSIENDKGPCIVNVNSALLTLMTDQEVRFVLGHELGHLIDHDSKMNSLISFVYPDATLMPIGLQHKVRLWSQLAELEADRYGYLACGSLEACVSAFYKMSSGLDIARMNVPLDVLLEENRSHLDYFLSDKGISVDTHPVNPIRVEGLNLYATSKSEKELKEGMEQLLGILMKVGCSQLDKPLSDFIATAGIVAASIDGAISEHEMEEILENLSAQQMFAKDYLQTVSQGDVMELFNTSVQKIMEIEPMMREALLRYVISIVMADNSLSKEEMEFVFEMGENAFGYSRKECAVMMAQQMQLDFTPDVDKLG